MMRRNEAMGSSVEIRECCVDVEFLIVCDDGMNAFFRDPVVSRAVE
jgi:hypothetical protein